MANFSSLRITFLLVVLGIGGSLPMASHAQSPTTDFPAASAQPERQWGLGAGISFKKKAYRDVDTDTTTIPLLTYENDWVRFAGPTVDLKLPWTTGSRLPCGHAMLSKMVTSPMMRPF